MKITHSKKITSFLTMLAEQKQLRVARPVAIFSTASSTSTAEEFVQVLSATYPGLPDLIRGVAVKSATSFFFVDSEEEVLQKLEEVRRDRKKGKTATKVLVKMIYSRIAKIQKHIEVMDDSVRMAIKAENQRKAAGQQPFLQQWARNWVKPVITREMLTIRDQLQNHWEMGKAQNDLVGVATRPDATEEIIDQAWALWEAHMVMQS